jgi:Transmembrane protein 18
MFLATLYVSRRNANLTPRIIVMVLIAGIVRVSEYINQYGNRYWKQFATQNYFDPKGIFMTIVICTPLLMNSFIMLISFLREASSLLIQVKTRQIQKQYDASKKKKQNQSKNSKNNEATNNMSIIASSSTSATTNSTTNDPQQRNNRKKEGKRSKIDRHKKSD